MVGSWKLMWVLALNSGELLRHGSSPTGTFEKPSGARVVGEVQS